MVEWGGHHGGWGGFGPPSYIVKKCPERYSDFIGIMIYTVCIKKKSTAIQAIAFQIQINLTIIISDLIVLNCFELMIRDENMSYLQRRSIITSLV